MHKRKDQLKGGRADKAEESDFDKKQLETGRSHEKEHTNNPKIAKEIAMDHLAEDPKYYTKLILKAHPSLNDEHP